MENREGKRERFFFSLFSRGEWSTSKHRDKQTQGKAKREGMWSTGLREKRGKAQRDRGLSRSLKKRTQKQTNEVNGIEFKQFSLGGRDERKDYRPLLPGLEHIHFPSLSFSLSVFLC